MAEFETILKGRRYVLGETEEYYGIWDRREGRGPFERFPLTAEGFDAAERRFHALSRETRWRGDRYRGVLVGVVIGGAVLWIVAGIVGALVGGLVFGGLLEAEGTFVELSYVLDAVGYRLAIGALAVLAALFVVSKPSPPPEPDVGQTESRGGLDRIFAATVAIGLAVWIVAAFATRTLEPPSPLGFPGEERTGTAYVVATLVEAVAFRVWVAAAVLLALRWTRRLDAATGSSIDGSE